VDKEINTVLDLFKKYSNDEIAQLIYDDFVKDKDLNHCNVRKRFERFENKFWARYLINENLPNPVLEHRKMDICGIDWDKIIDLEKKLVLKRNKVLNTKSDEELIEILYDKVKDQADLSSISLGIYWSELGVENIFSFPQTTFKRWEKINNDVCQKVKELKKQRRHEEIEKERNESFKLIDDIIEWVQEKGLKKLSKINLKLFLSEKKMNLTPVNRRALYLEVNKEIESKKENK